MTNNSLSLLVQVASLLLGGLLAIVGGFFGEFIRVKFKKKEEIDFIKVCLIDELTEMCVLIENITATFKKSSVVYLADLNKLRNSISNYTTHKQRIYLIGDENIRKEIRKFYSTFQEAIADASTQINSLGVKALESNPTHNTVLQKMESVSTSAANLKKTLGAYKYKPFKFF